MASQGPNSPSTAVDDSSSGSIAWASPSNALLNDGIYSTYTNNSSVLFSHYLVASNFGFSIPVSAVINGIVLEVESLGTGAVVDSSVLLAKGGVLGGTDKFSNTQLTASESYVSYGGSGDLWGQTWTEADINASNFGAAYKVFGTNPSTASVDHMRITVYYTDSGTTTSTSTSSTSTSSTSSSTSTTSTSFSTSSSTSTSISTSSTSTSSTSTSSTSTSSTSSSTTRPPEVYKASIQPPAQTKAVAS